jgi:hypothetical protein
MPRYFTYLDRHNAPANSLQKQALELLKANSNLLIGNVDIFVDNIRRRIDELNAEYPRCLPLRFSFSQYRTHGNLYLGAAFTVSFSIHEVKEVRDAN